MIRKTFIPFIIILLFTKVSKGQDFCCAVTNPSGSVTIQWTDATFATTDHYELLWASAPGGFNTTDSVSLPPSGVPDNSYTINALNGNISFWYFKLRIVPVSGASREITITNILLNVLYATPGNMGIARLTWNPVLPAAAGNFSVQRFEAPGWHNLAVYAPALPVATLTYFDTLSYPFCDTSEVMYRIIFTENSSPCQSVSNISSLSLFDNHTPADPVNDSVSIFNDPLFPAFTGCPVIGWSPVSASDIAGYIIYRFSGSAFITLDTIPPDSTIFVDKSVSACLQSYSYALATLDKCGRISPGTFVTSPGSILFTTTQIDPCTKKITLNWNNYLNMEGGLGGYRLYRQINNQPYELIRNLSPGEISCTDSMNFITGNYYTYFVQAYNISGSITSTSCQRRIIYQGPSSPDTLYIEQASVVNDSHIEVNCYYSPYASVNQLVLERADEGSAVFLPIDTISAPQGGFLSQKLTFYDYSADFRSRSYIYRLTYIDSCKIYTIAPYANTAQTIYLTCDLQNASANVLNWNSYATWLASVSRYEIYRYINGTNDPPGVLADVPSGTINYTDNLPQTDQTSDICYRVVAIENPGNPVVSGALSTSNLACAARDPLVFIPNAFAPYGINSRFRPKITFIEPGSFLMQIYNKWGQKIFETRDHLSGWDGKVNGTIANVDVYTYLILYKSLTGKEYMRRGLFTLVK